MKIAICVPCMETIEAQFIQSLENLKMPGECRVFYLPGSLVYVAREELTKLALEWGADYLLWLDSDMVFNPDTLERLLADDKDVVSGLYFRRKAPFTPVLYKKLKLGMMGSETEFEDYDKYPCNQMFEVEGCGFGCILVKAEVAKKVKDRFGVCFEPLKGVGEDLAWCFRARYMGYKITCDSRIKCGHIARTIVTEETYKAINKAKKKK